MALNNDGGPNTTFTLENGASTSFVVPGGANTTFIVAGGGPNTTPGTGEVANEIGTTIHVAGNSTPAKITLDHDGAGTLTMRLTDA
jgi:hypothetical protein